MYCDADYEARRTRRELEGKIDKLGGKLEKAFAEKLKEQRIKAPEIVQQFDNSSDNERYLQQDSNTAIYLKRATNGLIRMYEFDFSMGLTTISSIQQGTVTATETKKISEMPSKFVQKCRATLGTQNNRKPRTIRRDNG